MNNQPFSLCGEGVFIPTTRPAPNELVGPCGFDLGPGSGLLYALARNTYNIRSQSLGMGDDGSGGNGILGRGDDKGDSGDGDGDGDAGAIRQASMCASKDDGKGV
ncbi:hypothetical protein Tco_1474073 [Tanacetum coccineum]